MLVFPRISKFIVKNHKAVILIWLAIGIFGFMASQRLADVLLYEEEGGYEELESVQASEIIESEFPGNEGGSMIIIVHVNDNHTISALYDYTLALKSYFENKDIVESIIFNPNDPQFATNHTYLLMVYLEVQDDDDRAYDLVRDIRSEAEELQKDPSLVPPDMIDDFNMYVTGAAAMSTDTREASQEDLERIDQITIILVAIVLIAIFRSAVSPLLPLISIGIAIIATRGVLWFIAENITDVPYEALHFLTVIVMGIGADYCLFFLSRFKEELMKGASTEEAVTIVVERTGKTIVSSGATIAVAFGSFMISDMTFLRGIGLTLVIGVTLGTLASLTFIPALFMLLGTKVFWPRKITTEDVKNHDENQLGILGRRTRWVMKHAPLVLIASLVICAPLVYQMTRSEPSHDFFEMMPEDLESIQGFNVLTDEWSAGKILPTTVVVHTNGNLTEEENYEKAETIWHTLNASSDTSFVYGFTAPSGQAQNYTVFSSLPEENRTTILNQYVSADHDTAKYTVVLAYDPYSKDGIDAIDNLRNSIQEVKQNENGLENFEILVGGSTAEMSDFSTRVFEEFETMQIILIIAILLILVFLLGSITLSVKQIVTILLSVAITIGIVTLVFQTLQNQPVIFFLEIMIFLILMGLGTDYNIFLLSRVREEYDRGREELEAMVYGVDKTGIVITSAAAIMAAAFGSLMFSSLLMMQEFGFALFVAVVIDASFVRLILVPAIYRMLKGYNYWPKIISEKFKFIAHE
ncbi:MAG: MMPL family transporter [Candidatus Hodarchaeota archaeon]